MVLQTHLIFPREKALQRLENKQLMNQSTTLSQLFFTPICHFGSPFAFLHTVERTSNE
jgi:hypothetical protein